ncbi:pollen-specific leucine-rich repeat extensin-like protein 1 [Acanthaster planci]|uniref:Pollen-specific leucine-rich repeat extensin-like protein 1 n=1 Tax=Acanthaster planci TaxID=133434 RepID=A0A8B7ZM79_ACAPL|nr:pollen-specific leucine-rich repeat extensin-like protein 1 [Acanthaster planci]
MMTEFPTLCVLHYDRDGAEAHLSTTVGLRLPRPRKPRSRSRTHPREREGAEGSDREGLEFLARGVQASGDYGGKTQITTPYRYSSSKSSSLQASRDDNLLYPDRAHSSFATPELPHCLHSHHRSLSEPPPHASERARTAPTSSFSLPVLRQGGAGETSLTVNAELLQDPKWNEYLNAWVSGAQVGSHAFVNFVGAMSLKDRGRYHYVRQFEELPALPCPRFLEHMHHIPAPKAMWKEKKKALKKPEFWTWKGRTSPKVPKPKPVRKRVQVCNSLQAVQVTPHSSVKVVTVDLPTCSQDSQESLTSTPTSDLCSLSNPTPSMRAPSPVRSPEEVLPEIEEYSEPSDYGSIRSGTSSPVSVRSQHTATSVPLKLHKLENPPRPPTTVDWDSHSYLADLDDSDDSDTEGAKTGQNQDKDDADSPPEPKRRDVTTGPLETSKVDQSSYMYNDHMMVLEPVVYESYLPLDDPSEMMRSITVPGCEQSVVDPYPLEEPLRPDVADVNRTVVHQSSILTRPELPTPPPPPSPPKEPTPPPTPPPPKEPTPPPKTPTPPPILKPKKKPSKPKRQ